MKLWNINPHAPPGRCIEAIDLLHFTADAIADWECNQPCHSDCPWWYESTHIKADKTEIKNKLCILESIKDCAFLSLDPIPEEEDELDRSQW